MNSLELLINLIIIGLLLPTIIFAYRLNKNLEALRANQGSLSKLIQALNDATFKAENSIPKLKTATEHSSENLKEVVDSAKTLKDDLLFINERADNLANKLENAINDGRQIKASPAANVSSRIDSGIGKIKIDSKYQPDIEDSRSDAEMELLKALRSIK